MKVRAKETKRMDDGNEVWIIKDKTYDLSRETENYYYFKSEFYDNHGVPKDQVEDYFIITPDKPKLCEILGIEFNKPYNIKGYENNPIKVKYSNNNREITVINKWGVISSKTLINLIEHPELIEKIPEWTEEQKETFKALKILGFNYLARDLDRKIYSYITKPIRCRDGYISSNDNDTCFNYLGEELLNFIKWEDEEPFKIPDIQ